MAMEASELESYVDSIDSVTSPDPGPCVWSTGAFTVSAGPCESSTGDLTVAGRIKTKSKDGRVREPVEPLIVAALRSAPGKRMLVTDIYRWIETHSEDYRDDRDSARRPSSTSTGDGKVRRKEPAWKIHVRHILSVKRDVFPLTTEKDGKRRGRYHALDELQYANRLAAKAHGCGIESRPTVRRHRRSNHSQPDRTTRPQTHVSSQCIYN